MLFDSLFRYKTLNVSELNHLMTKLPRRFELSVNQVSCIAAAFYVLHNIPVLQSVIFPLVLCASATSLRLLALWLLFPHKMLPSLKIHCMFQLCLFFTDSSSYVAPLWESMFLPSNKNLSCKLSSVS